LCLIPARLKTNERTFVLFAGLKGAVPILLGSFLLAAHVPGAERLYGIVAVVVVFSVVVQGSLIPACCASGTDCASTGCPTETASARRLSPTTLRRGRTGPPLSTGSGRSASTRTCPTHT
jgi:NhaP-type Na+/H+ or K+/H+ antiporter